MTLVSRWLLLVTLLLPAPATAQAYDPAAPCGRDAQGNALPCRSVRDNMLEATCTTTANPYYCLPYQQRACQVNGFPLACRMANLGQHCYGGNPETCQYYVTLLRANRDCNVNGHQPACLWLRAQL